MEFQFFCQYQKRLEETGYRQVKKGDYICPEPYKELTEKRGIAYSAAVVDCFFDLYNEKPDAFHEKISIRSLNFLGFSRLFAP